MNPPALLWGMTVGGFVALFAADFSVALQHRRDPSLRACAGWSASYGLLAVLFGAAMFVVGGARNASTFFTDWLTALALNIDMIFVFALILTVVALPRRHRLGVLLFGIATGLVTRFALITFGVRGEPEFAWLLFAFGTFALYAGFELFERGERGTGADRRKLDLHVAEGTVPVLIALGGVSVVGVVFAVNALPSASGEADGSYLRFCAMAFAMLFVRQLVFALLDLLDRLLHVATCLAVVFAVIGTKWIMDALLDRQLSHDPGVLALSVGLVAAALALTAATSPRDRTSSGPARDLPNGP